MKSSAILPAVLAAMMWATVVSMNAASAQDCGCAATECDAGCDGCGNVCVLVPTKVKKTVTCYGCKCKDFCVPCKSINNGDKHCSCGKTCKCRHKCKCGAEHSPRCVLCEKSWEPTSANIRTKKVLVKYEKTIEFDSWEWKVMPGCQADKCGCAARLRPAPENAYVGQVLPASEDLIRQVSAEVEVRNTQAKTEAKVEPAKQGSLTAMFGKLLKK